MEARITLKYLCLSWSSSENNSNNSWNQRFSDGNQNNNNKNNTNRVRAVRTLNKTSPLYFKLGGIVFFSFVFLILLISFVFSSVQLDIYDKGIELEEIFEAYFSCRKNKRNTMNALAFEVDYEKKLVELHEEINEGRYRVGRSVAFVVENPVKREIFASDFRDRIVHHLIINQINPYLDKTFIFDSYACREGKGTLFGVKRLDKSIRRCSRNYTSDCYILKLDIKGFFMNIDRSILFENLKTFFLEKYPNLNKKILLRLSHQVIFNEPTRNCIVNGKPSDWNEIPKDKSLFTTPKGCGLPIGNLTSQVFANLYMNPFDHFVKKELGIKYYGRYVDDFFLIHKDCEFLKSLIPKISNFLEKKLGLKLHPKKIYLQHYSKGVQYLGAFVKQERMYLRNRTKGNFFLALKKQNAIFEKEEILKKDLDNFLSSMNSYLGIMKHFKTFNLRNTVVEQNLGFWKNYAYLDIDGFSFSKKKFLGKSALK